MNKVLRNAYNNCKPEESLLSEDPRYVKFGQLGLRGDHGDLVSELRQVIFASDDNTRQLVSGFRGSGKTTELRRLTTQLQDDGYWVIYIDTDEYLNLRVPATVSDLWISIAGAVDKFVESAAPKTHALQRWWERAEAFFKREVVIESANFGVSGAAIQLALKENPDLRKRINEALESKRPALVKECREYVEEAVAFLAGEGRGKLGTVIIIDSFEKLQGDARSADEVRASAENLFVRDWGLFEAPCHMIFTVPPWLAFTDSGPNLARTRMLPMCKVIKKPAAPGAPRRAHREGIDAMLEMLRRRMDLEEIFGHSKVPETLIKASGGYPRDLLRLVRETLLPMLGAESLPIPSGDLKKHAKRAIDSLREQYALAVNAEDLRLFRTISDKLSVVGLERTEKLRIAELFEHHFVLAYSNGSRWLDLHPLVREIPEVAAVLASSAASDE